jgi:hypothetical protein
MRQDNHPHLDLEYTQVNNNIRFLAEVRFKLLALLPTLGGAAVFALAHLGLKADTAAALPSTDLPIVFVVSLFGFFATLGITLYDQRNSELYNALMHRAKFLEKQFDVRCSPGGLKQPLSSGQFNERPRKGRRFFSRLAMDSHVKGDASSVTNAEMSFWINGVRLVCIEKMKYSVEWKRGT